MRTPECPGGTGKRDIKNGISAGQVGIYRAGKEDGQAVSGNLQHTTATSVATIQNAR